MVGFAEQFFHDQVDDDAGADPRDGGGGVLAFPIARVPVTAAGVPVLNGEGSAMPSCAGRGKGTAAGSCRTMRKSGQRGHLTVTWHRIRFSAGAWFGRSA